MPSDKEFVISDAFVVLSNINPATSAEVAQQFLQYLSEVYLLLPKPETSYHDWPGISEKTMNDLYENKGCWTQTGGLPYLNAYVSDYKTPSEIMVQLAVLLPLREYFEWSGKEHPLYNALNSGLNSFYDSRVQSIVRWHPLLEDQLDKSEEQKREMVMDSWYLHHPLLNLSRLSLKGDAIAKQLFLDSLDYAIRVAHHFDYEWPVFYKMTTLEVLKAEAEPGKGGEKDVPASYAHVMLMAWKPTNEKKYLNEAIKAVKKLEDLGLEIFYQANNTAFAAGALLELYKETNVQKYLDLSNCCLAGIFKNVKIWDCQYGFGNNFPNFFAVFPLNDAPYTAAYEELEVYAALHHYLVIAEDVPILPALKILIPEFIRYTVSRLPYYYPYNLPEDMIAEEIKTGEVKKDLWIPLEDLYVGWDKSGQVGQEVYGAGLPFGIVPRQYFHIEDRFTIFVDYPVVNFKKSGSKIILQIAGNKEMECKMKIFGESKSAVGKLLVEIKNKGKFVQLNGDVEYTIPGDSKIRITL